MADRDPVIDPSHYVAAYKKVYFEGIGLGIRVVFDVALIIKWITMIGRTAGGRAMKGTSDRI